MRCRSRTDDDMTVGDLFASLDRDVIRELEQQALGRSRTARDTSRPGTRSAAADGIRLHPVMNTVEQLITAERRDAFLSAVTELGRQRWRHGAYSRPG
jgi:hypothetical protein